MPAKVAVMDGVPIRAGDRNPSKADRAGCHEGGDSVVSVAVAGT